MPRFDKYEPKAGGFRARLAADWAAADGVAIAVGLDSSGRVVPGAGNSGIKGVVILVVENKLAGDTVDVMTSGEILEFSGVAGTTYTANTTTGVISSAAASATQVAVGFTVEADRLVVRA